MTRRFLLLICILRWAVASRHHRGLTSPYQQHADGQTQRSVPQLSTHQCTGRGYYGMTCLLYSLVLWQKHFYYISDEEVTIPEVREGWHMWWHPYGQAMLPEHVTVVHPSHLPWEQADTASQPTRDYLDQALMYNWLDQANMYHVLMETGNFIYATACKLLNACSHASSHYQILATGHFQYGEDNGLPAGHESLKCLSSAIPRWIGDAHWDDKVVTIGTTAVGIGVQCEDPMCEWDSVPFMQSSYTSGHRQLMIDCLGLDSSHTSQPSKNNTRVTIAQRLFSRGRSFLNVVEMQTALQRHGAAVEVAHLEGKSLKEQAQILSHTHIYILFHGAAMALYMFLPKNAAIIEIQHYYADSPTFPGNLYGRTIAKYDMGYRHAVLVSPQPQDIVLQRDKILNDDVYKSMTAEGKIALWEQGLCPDLHDNITDHCVSKWIFYAGNLIVNIDELMNCYDQAWEGLPADAVGSQ